MHFKDVTKAMTQKELEDELSNCTKKKYEKSEGIRKMISDDDIDEAIDRASKHISNFDDSIDSCFNCNPNTTVHFLVKSLIDSKDSDGKIQFKNFD